MREPNLSRKLLLEERDRVADGAGGHTGSWIVKGTLWAEVRARGGREPVAAGREAPQVPVRIVVRGAPVGAASRPRADQRFRDGNRVYRILSVAEEDAYGRYLTCSALEGVQA